MSKILKDYNYFAKGKRTGVIKPNSLSKLEIRVTDGIARKKELTEDEVDEVIELMPEKDYFTENGFYTELDVARKTASQGLSIAAGKNAEKNTTVREQTEGKEYIKEKRYSNMAS